MSEEDINELSAHIFFIEPTYKYDISKEPIDNVFSAYRIAVKALIRTEKLKAQTDILQEGISESKEFCGEDVDINLGWVNFKLNKLQQSLDKLEAEL